MLFALTKIYYPTLMDLEDIQNSNATNVKLVYVTSIFINKEYHRQSQYF